MKKSFLLSHQIRRSVCGSHPKEANVAVAKLWRLRVAAYGLVGDAVDWYMLIIQKLEDSIHECNMTHFYATNELQQIRAVKKT